MAWKSGRVGTFLMSVLTIGILTLVFCFTSIHDISLRNTERTLQDLTESAAKPSDVSPATISDAHIAYYRQEPCKPVSQFLKGRSWVNMVPQSFQNIELGTPGLRHGGEHLPYCLSRHEVAIIVPFRDSQVSRLNHLKVLLLNLHPFLQRQEVHYRIFLAVQGGTNIFNKAMLMNSAYSEVMKIHNWTCIVFHDVDMYPENDKNLYNCDHSPKHLGVYVDKFNYHLPYNILVGGAFAISPGHFEAVNGFSNQFWGWGGEDDDFAYRIRDHKYEIFRYPQPIPRYKMYQHNHDNVNPPNQDRVGFLAYKSIRFAKFDGLNNLRYNLVSTENNYLFTNLTFLLSEVKAAAVP